VQNMNLEQDFILVDILTKNMVVSRDRNAGQGQSVKIDSSSV
jgi:hypothetical protein